MKPQVPIAVQNLPEPFDRRVWFKGRAVAPAAITRRSGKPASDVTVIRTDPDPQDGVDIALRPADIDLAWLHYEGAYLGVYRCLVSLGTIRERTKA